MMGKNFNRENNEAVDEVEKLFVRIIDIINRDARKNIGEDDSHRAMAADAMFKALDAKMCVINSL